jgi:hypothetical protein
MHHIACAETDKNILCRKEHPVKVAGVCATQVRAAHLNTNWEGSACAADQQQQQHFSCSSTTRQHKLHDAG